MQKCLTQNWDICWWKRSEKRIFLSDWLVLHNSICSNILKRNSEILAIRYLGLLVYLHPWFTSYL